MSDTERNGNADFKGNSSFFPKERKWLKFYQWPVVWTQISWPLLSCVTLACLSFLISKMGTFISVLPPPGLRVRNRSLLPRHSLPQASFLMSPASVLSWIDDRLEVDDPYHPPSLLTSKRLCLILTTLSSLGLPSNYHPGPGKPFL